jgi:hypothetical protein
MKLNGIELFVAPLLEFHRPHNDWVYAASWIHDNRVAKLIK